MGDVADGCGGEDHPEARWNVSRTDAPWLLVRQPVTSDGTLTFSGDARSAGARRCHSTQPSPNPVIAARREAQYGDPFMNNAELAETLVADLGMTKPDARKAVDGVMAAIVSAAAKGEEITLAGFGKFKIKDSPAREGRNPGTGEAIQIAASRKLTFVQAKAVKDALNG